MSATRFSVSAFTAPSSSSTQLLCLTNCQLPTMDCAFVAITKQNNAEKIIIVFIAVGFKQIYSKFREAVISKRYFSGLIVNMMKYLVIVFSALVLASCKPSVKEDENLLENLMRQHPEKFDSILSN